MNIKQAIINCADKQVYINAHQAAALIKQCTPAEWAAYVADAKRSGSGVICVINKARVLGGRNNRTSFPGVDDAPVPDLAFVDEALA